MPNPELQAAIEALRVDVTEIETVVDSAIEFINGLIVMLEDLRSQLEQIGASPEQLALIAQFGAQLDAKKDALAAPSRRTQEARRCADEVDADAERAGDSHAA